MISFGLTSHFLAFLKSRNIRLKVVFSVLEFRIIERGIARNLDFVEPHDFECRNKIKSSSSLFPGGLLEALDLDQVESLKQDSSPCQVNPFLLQTSLLTQRFPCVVTHEVVLFLVRQSTTRVGRRLYLRRTRESERARGRSKTRLSRRKGD